jgi:hypothetical protein
MSTNVRALAVFLIVPVHKCMIHNLKVLFHFIDFKVPVYNVLSYVDIENRNIPFWWRQYAPLKRRSTIILHGSTTQKTALNIPFPSKLLR